MPPPLLGAFGVCDRAILIKMQLIYFIAVHKFEIPKFLTHRQKNSPFSNHYIDNKLTIQNYFFKGSGETMYLVEIFPLFYLQGFGRQGVQRGFKKEVKVIG